jgi:hypothetical protein
MEFNISFIPKPFYAWGKGLWHTLNKRLGELQNQSGCFQVEKNQFPFLRIKL